MTNVPSPSSRHPGKPITSKMAAVNSLVLLFTRIGYKNTSINVRFIHAVAPDHKMKRIIAAGRKGVPPG
jgi:hypothetical protein